jgi:hypothetical protein
MFRKKASESPPKPEQLVFSDSQVQRVAEEIAFSVLRNVASRGDAKTDISERATAVSLNSMMMNIYSTEAQKLWDRGIRDKQYYAVVASNVNRVASEIVKILAKNGMQVDHLLAQEAEWSKADASDASARDS